MNGFELPFFKCNISFNIVFIYLPTFLVCISNNMFGMVVNKILSVYVSNILPQKIKKKNKLCTHTSGNVKQFDKYTVFVLLSAKNKLRQIIAQGHIYKGLKTCLHIT